MDAWISEPIRIFSGTIPTTLSALSSSVLPVPSDTKLIIAEFNITNKTGSEAVVDIHIVPSGGSADSSNRIYSRRIKSSISTPGGDLESHRRLVLEPGDNIYAVSTVANLTLYVSGAVATRTPVEL
jgi:hypothetical protein